MLDDTRVTYDSATGRCGIWPLRWRWTVDVREHHPFRGPHRHTISNGYAFTRDQAERGARRAITRDQRMRASIRSRTTGTDTDR